MVIGGSRILELGPDDSRETILERVAGIAEYIAIVPPKHATAEYITEVAKLSVAHLTGLGVEDAEVLVMAAIMQGQVLRRDDAMREVEFEQREKELQEKEKHRYGARQEMLVALAATMRRGGFNQQTIYAALVAENRRCEPPLVPDELDAITREICRFAPADVPRTRQLTTEIKKAVKAATSSGPPPSEDESLPNFKVEKVLVADSDPPRYWLTIDGQDYPWSAEELSSATRFKLRFMKAVRRVPLRLPKSPGAWDELVDGWLARATTMVQPADASDEILIRDHIHRGLEGLALGDGLIDLESGKGIVHDGHLCFKSIAAVRIGRELDHRIGSHEVCAHLRRLGYENTVINIRLHPDKSDYKAVRVWQSPRPVEAPPEEAGTPVAGGNGHAPVGVGLGASSSDSDAPAPTEDPDETYDLPL
jgi:hypothetical protein